MFRMIPDLDLLDNFLASQNTDWVTITVRGLAEMKGDQSSSVPNNTGSWINLSPCELDEFGVARAWVQLVATGADNAVWETMDQAALALVQGVAGGVQPISNTCTIAAGRACRPLSKPFGFRCAKVWGRRITNPGHCGWVRRAARSPTKMADSTTSATPMSRTWHCFRQSAQPIQPSLA